MSIFRLKIRPVFLGLWLLAVPALSAPNPPVPTFSPVTPVEHRRGPEQTFLTFPEWFLVFSPAEYADFIQNHRPSDFPYWGHLGQFWGSYAKVIRATWGVYAPNPGYHVMIVVIGASTTVEYGLKSAYETLIGRISERFGTPGQTEEDQLAAQVAQDYVAFIRVNPWYDYDFGSRFKQVWTQTGLWGKNPVRKWERKYFLSTEYGTKTLYGWAIRKLTHAAYETPILSTACWLDKPPTKAALKGIKVLRKLPDGSVLVLLPRYEAFMNSALLLAKQRIDFREIAGNRGVILVSAIIPSGETTGGLTLLFTQPILTQPGWKRVALEVPVPQLSPVLRALNRPPCQVEHVFDY
jgi:hypothetical protein